MSEKLTFKLITRNEQSNFDWVNIEWGTARVGKARGLINGRILTIYSIYIFSEFERNGYAKRIIEMFKQSFDIIIADRVRHTAVGFWIKMGFTRREDGNYMYHKKREIDG